LQVEQNKERFFHRLQKILLNKFLFALLQKCERCKRPIADGEIGVVAPKFGDDVLWHPACFTCDSCKELLVDLTYCVHDEDIFCERHYAEKLKPRCSSCDEVSTAALFTIHGSAVGVYTYYTAGKME
jgi:hypothetical protein